MLTLKAKTVALPAFLKQGWIAPAAVFVLAGLVYWLSALLFGRDHSPDTAYFDHLADAFLHGRLYLAAPLATDDLTPFGGHWYVPFPPLPALLLLPWAALAGAARVNTVLFSAVVGAANAALAYLFLRALACRGWTRLGWGDNLWLTALFAVGTVHWYMSTIGSVWFVAQICTVTFMLAAVWIAASSGSAPLAGAALALAMLGRPHVALCYPLVLALGARARGRRAACQSAGWIALSVAPLLAAGGMLLAYNYARFGGALDFGYLKQKVSPELANDLRRYGQFNLHYLPHNLWAMLLAGPKWDLFKSQIRPTIDGMSLFLTTPALGLIFFARRRSAEVLGAWLALGLLLIPLLTYYNTGWWQFGYRFSLDFMAPVLLLLAVGAGERVGWPARLLILLGVIANAWGVWWFANPTSFP